MSIAAFSKCYPEAPQHAMLTRRIFALLVAAVAVALGAPSILLGQNNDQKIVRDRNGVVLIESADADGQKFLLRALGAQVLVGLDRHAEAAKSDVNLTLDARIQVAAEQALRAVPRGAAVVVDPSNGDLLAVVSVPSFDPNTLSPSAWAAIEADKTELLVNRALRAATPGATFMVVTGLAGARNDLMDSRFECKGSVTFGNKVMKCWIDARNATHGSLTLDEALEASCGPYFFQYGNKVGIEEILRTGTLLGLGVRSGVPLEKEDAGVLPGPEWLRALQPRERWSPGYTANVSIGQSYVSVTPLQMAMVAATLGNGGRAYAPRLLLSQPVRLRADLVKEGWSKEQIEIVRRGMWRVVNEGIRGARARLAGVQVAGMTGTAQFWRNQNGENVKDNHAWFIAFAPYEDPKFAVCVLVEGAKAGGAVAAPIARQILDACLGDKSSPRIEPMKPATGSFEFIEGVEE